MAEPLAPLAPGLVALIVGADAAANAADARQAQRDADEHGAGEQDLHGAAQGHCFTCTWFLAWQASHMLWG